MKIFINFDKEEKWLRDMASKGYELNDISILGYGFRKAKPNDTVIRIDYRSFKNDGEYREYLSFFQDCGWQRIAGSRFTGLQYFKKISSDSSDHIFSDNISRAARYKKLSLTWLFLTITYLLLFVSLITNKNIDIKALFDFKLTYYTPGLWKMTGIKFWSHFLFETPFAVGRSFVWLIIPIGIIIAICFTLKARNLYIKQKDLENE